MQTYTQRLIISKLCEENISNNLGQLCWASLLHAWDNRVQSFSVSGVHQTCSQATDIQTNYLADYDYLYFISRRRHSRFDVPMQTCRSTVLTKSWTTPTKFTKLCRFTSHGRRRHWANAFLMTSLFTCSQQTLFSLTLPSLSFLFLFFLKHRSQTGRRYGRAINSRDSKLNSGLGCLDWIICSLQLHDYLFHHANGSNYHNCEEWKFYHACSLGYH